MNRIVLGVGRITSGNVKTVTTEMNFNPKYFKVITDIVNTRLYAVFDIDTYT